jgi:hypothetical protein
LYNKCSSAKLSLQIKISKKVFGATSSVLENTPLNNLIVIGAVTKCSSSKSQIQHSLVGNRRHELVLNGGQTGFPLFRFFRGAEVDPDVKRKGIVVVAGVAGVASVAVGKVDGENVVWKMKILWTKIGRYR